MNPIATETGISGTLTLPDGLQLSLDYTFDEQYEITFR